MSTDRTAEILNYLSAMSRDIGEFRQETKARFDRIEARLDALESEMKQVKEGLASVRTEVQILTKKLNAIIVEAADTRARLSMVEERVEALGPEQET